MFKAARPFFLIVETSLHAGSGNDLGIIDLPIQRERHTGYPKIEGSGIKGCVRDKFEKMFDKTETEKKIECYFGPSNPRGDEGRAGVLGFTDARLLLFPVKSLRGVFAWITCPGVLQRFVDDLTLPGVKPDVEKDFIKSIGQMSHVDDKTAVLPKDTNLEFGESIILEEYTFEVSEEKRDTCACIAEWLAENVFPGGEYSYWSEKMKKDLAILSDNDFRDFVELSTEVITRIEINNKTGTVQPGALFNEEYLPADTIMYSMALASPLKGNSEEEIIDFFTGNGTGVLQIGGNATIGKGLTRINVLGEVKTGGETNG